MSSTPTLNWKEAALLAATINPEIQGLFVDRFVIPERANFPEGHLRNEWVIRLTGRRAEVALFFSIRPRHPYLALCLTKGPKAATQATHSPFSLNLSKQLKGAKVLGLEALPQERILVLWLTAEGASPEKERLGLVLAMIPAVPEALLVRSGGPRAIGADAEWKILARSRTLSAERSQATYAPPTGSKAPEAPIVREEFFTKPDAFFKIIDRELDQEAFEVRLLAAQRELRELIKQARDRIRQSGTALREAQRESDWQLYGELLKASLHDLPPPNERGERRLVDYTQISASDHDDGNAGRDTDVAPSAPTVLVPGDPQLEPRQQIEKFFQMARRKARRAEESRLRIETFTENQARWEAALARIPVAGDWPALEKLERLANTQPQIAAPHARSPGKGKVSSWLGKSFVSKDGLKILAGRSKDENLELTFKHARGGDIWLHVRGRPGAHVLVPLTSGKSAPLETLLDAATLAIYYSGGEKWGKTEVDYTFKKYVRRIKDSSEASYTHNKTLLVEPDAARIKRLLASQDAE